VLFTFRAVCPVFSWAFKAVTTDDFKAVIVDFCAAIMVRVDVKPDAQEPLLEINEQCVGLLGCNIPKEFYIPLGRLRIGKTIGAGAFGTIKVRCVGST
jgi:hypothetical protein